MKTLDNLIAREPYLYHSDFLGTDVWIRDEVEIATINEQKTYGVRVEPGDVVLDLGAHIGATALYFLMRGAGKVHSFEPMWGNYEILRLNAENRNIEPKRAAIIGDDRDSVPMYSAVSESSTTHSLHFKKNRVPEIVPAVNFTRLVDSLHPEVVKIDIEGGEVFLLDGLSKMHEHVRSVAIEVHYKFLGRHFGQVIKDLMSEHYDEVRPLKYIDEHYKWPHSTGLWERKA